MRQSRLAIAVLGTLLTLASSAQESLCNPCVDPPVDGIRREDFIRTDRTTTITAEEMRNLGIVSVAEMVNQLPSAVAGPVSLGKPDSFPVQSAAAFRAAASHVQELEYDPGEFNARLIMCAEGTCILYIYPSELGNVSVTTVHECPLEYCATMSYSLTEGRVLEVLRWRQAQRSP